MTELINKEIYATCQDPVTISVYDGVLNCYVEKQVPCGKCYHCKMTRINEWVTRMVIQANYVNYVYYGTLTYDGKYETELHKECLSFKTNKNYTGNTALTPLVLRKDHFQKFIKRLRKNTGLKFQYACCGEYGSTYGRPHFHYIMFSDQPISTRQILKAWSARDKDNPGKRRIIGRIEHRDIKNQPYLEKDQDNTHVYKYVCKYLQKTDYDFEKIPTIDIHKQTYHESFILQKYNYGTQYYHQLDDWSKNKNIKSWDDYKKVYSPFFHCSKKPAIGYDYLCDHLNEFQKANFKLFGISKEYIFPLYFIRKTKESLCPLQAASETTADKTSYSRLPLMETLLYHINIAREIAESTNYIVQPLQYNGNLYTIESNERLQQLERLETDRYNETLQLYRFKREYLNFYDLRGNVYYSFRGSYYARYQYNRKTRLQECIGSSSIDEVINLIHYYYDLLLKNILIPLHASSEKSANKKKRIITACGGEAAYKEKKKHCIQQLMNRVNRNQQLYKQTKTFQ